MTAVQPSVPTIVNAGTRATIPHKLFVNVPVNDLQRSITFFEALGFAFNPQFTGPSSTCMLVGEDAYFMLLDKDLFAAFAKGPIGDPREATSAMYALSVDTREDVEAMVQQAIAAGGSAVGDKQDDGYMYSWGFTDLDRYRWKVIWMDTSAVPQ